MIPKRASVPRRTNGRNVTWTRTPYVTQPILHTIYFNRSPISIATGYGLLAGVQFLGLAKIFLRRPVLRPTQFPMQGAPRTDFQAVKRMGREAGHSPPSRTEVKNGSSWHSA
jgi:hypothetical protein